MKHLSLMLASKSPARLATLEAAGIEPSVRVSHVDEPAVLAEVRGGPSQQVLALATAKARAVLGELRSMEAEPGADSLTTTAASPTPSPASTTLDSGRPDLILGCDSMFEFDGQVFGKPHTPEVAKERLTAMAGHSGILHTGHCLLQGTSGEGVSALSHATVHVSPMSEAEIDAYIASTEPLWVAGSFTVDGLGGPFITQVEGDYHGVVGLSLPRLREMLACRGLSITQLWTEAAPADGPESALGREYLSRTRPFTPRHGADGFILCSCGRRHWGLAGAAGVCAFRDHEGRREVLMQLRSQWSHGGGTWSIPGGAIEWYEDPLAGGRREFSEETGITDVEVVAKHTVDHGDWAYTTYVARCADGVVPTPDAESIELRWIGVDDLPENLHPSFAKSWPQVRALVLEAD
ncbi:MAG: Maf family nucleotide pyrophosphatase [Ancrocorticia sp.]|uniref:Maf family nucleotide pyrophosphatase n=1 Tax=Ancrocorticia sp. TaxID=2593684 RepID=UPI003F903A60